MTIEEIKNLLENKLNRIEKCETQFFIGQKQQIADVLLLLSKLSQVAVILPLLDKCCLGANRDNFGGVCNVCGGINNKIV